MRNWVWAQERGERGLGVRGPGGGVGLAGLQADAKSCRTATRPHWCGGRRRVRRAWSRCRWAAAGPGRASRSTTPSRQARVWRSRGRAAAHRHTERPGPSRQATRRPEHQRGHKHQHAAQTARGRAAAHRHTERPDRTRQIMRSGWRACRAKLAARTARGRAAAHGHTKWPGLTRQKIRQPEVWQLVRRLNSVQDAQQLEPQQINEKCPLKRHRSQLHSNAPKSHMRNMRAS